MGTTMLTIKQCNMWRLQQDVNPTTGKQIKVRGPTWRAIDKQYHRAMKDLIGESVYIRECVAENVKREMEGKVTMCGDDDAAVVILTEDLQADIEVYGEKSHVMTVKQYRCDVLGDEKDVEEVCRLWRGNPNVNPLTGMKIKSGGSVWKKLEKMCAAVAERVSGGATMKNGDDILARVEAVSLNHEDPVTFDAWKDMSSEDLQNVVMLGSETPGKFYCLSLDTAFNIYKTAVESGKLARNPIAMDRMFTHGEIQDILNKMKMACDNFVAPTKEIKLLRVGVKLDMQNVVIPMFGYQFHFVAVTVIDRVDQMEYVLMDLGYIPGWVDTEHIGSADYTSGVLLTNIWALWNERKFFPKYKEPYRGCTVARLNPQKPYSPMSWFGHGGRFQRNMFIDLCQEVSEVLAG